MSKIRYMMLSTVALAVAGTMGATSAAEDNITQIDEVVVTGVFQAGTKLESSVSVSSINPEVVRNAGARSVAEVFQNLPGIRSESSSGGGNANIKIRGLPLSAGGSKFMQIHEDGMPVTEFGDIIFGNTDNYVRYDATVAKVESIRGGSASTTASNSPGGVINMISKTGEEQGGNIEFGLGLDYNLFRVDVDYGSGELDNGWRYHIGGFYNTGEGVRDLGYDAHDGGQIKANATKEFDKGYVRFYGKVLNDTTPTVLPQVIGVNSNGDYGPLNGFDLREEGTQEALLNLPGADGRTGNRIPATYEDGITSEVTSFGIELSYELLDGLTLNEKLRINSIEGNFTAPLNIGISRPSASSFTATELAFNVDADDLGSTTNDISLTKEFDNGSLTVGYYTNDQDLVTTWNAWPIYGIIGDSSGVRFDGGSIAEAVSRTYDYNYEQSAFYAAVDFSVGNLDVDLSYRADESEASGVRRIGVTTNAVTGAIFVDPSDPTTPVAPLNYSHDEDSFSLGLNYSVNDSSSVFGRFSRGYRFNADRLLDFCSTIVNGVPEEGCIADEVEQLEIGYKYQSENLDVYITYFDADSDESNSEITSGLAFQREYSADGFELEVDYAAGNGFGLYGTVTLTDSEITAENNNPEFIGNTPRRQADYIFTLRPSFTTDKYSVGVNLVGSDDFFFQDDNVLKQDSYVLVNPYVNYTVNDKLSLNLTVNNLTDEYVVTEAEGDAPATVLSEGWLRGRPMLGRSTYLTVRYDF